MANDETFARIARPSHETGSRSPLALALEATLVSGDAIRVPVAPNETYAVTRNRIAGRGFQVAKRLHAKIRTARNADGSVAIWLEAKS